MRFETITKQNIRKMVDLFYSQVIKDPLLAHYFTDKLGDEMISQEWQTHLDLLADFWASITLNDSNYKGQPLQAHLDLEGLTQEHFTQWLKLFFHIIDKVYPENMAEIFKQRAQMIAQNFIRQLGL